MKKLFSIQLFFIFLLTNIGFSQNKFDLIKFIPIKEGLPKRGVNSILEDKNGFMWFGLDGAGLFRFDGSNYKQFIHKNGDSTSINGNFVLSNFIDSENRMWVGTNFGLNLYNEELGTFKQFDEINKLNSTGELRIRAILQLDEDHLLLGTNDYGVIKFNLKTYKADLVSFKTFPKRNIDVRCLASYSGKIYAMTTKGLVVYDDEEELFEMAAFSTKEGMQTIPYSTESFAIDEANNLWLGTARKGLFKVSSQDNIYNIQQFSFTKKRILSLVALKGNHLFCSSENDGLFFVLEDYEKEDQYNFKKISSNVLNSNSIWTLYIDSKDRVWTGTFNKGVSVYDKLHTKFNDIANLPNNNSLQSRAVSGIMEDELGNIWIGIDGAGIDIFNPITRQLQTINTVDKSEYTGLTSNDVTNIFMDSHGNIWVSTWGAGMYFLKKGTKRFINYTKENTKGNLTSNRSYGFSEDSSGRIWIATFDSGLIYFEPKKNSFFHCNTKEFKDNRLLDTQIRSVKVDEEDNIWLGSTTGLFKATFEFDKLGNPSFDLKSFKKEMLEISNNHASTNSISSIFLTKNKNILVGTEGAGLFILDPKDGFRHYDNTDFFEETIGAIVEGADNSIWASGSRGIVNLELDSDTVVIYNKDDGFLSNYFFVNSVCSASDGTIYYGNDLGLNYFNPETIKFNTDPPKLHFTSFKIFNKEITPHQKDSPLSKVISKTSTISLNHDQSVFTIHYIGINFTRPEKNQYAYQLEGVDPDWRYVGNEQKATYTNLKTGTYNFKVKATNNDGLWTEESLELEIKVLPPWWKSNLAYFSYFILFISSIYLFQKTFRSRINEKQVIQIEREKRLQEEQLSQQKLEFFTNISHEFRTPLTLIINPLEDIIKNKDLNLPEELKLKHQIIYKNSHRLNRLINELMDFRKIQFHKMTIQAEQVEVVNYIRETLSYFNEEAKERNIKLEFTPNTDNLIAWIDVSMLEKIIFNLVSNAFKVTPNQGTISLSIEEKQIYFPKSNFKESKEGFEISIKDTGGGLTQSEISQIFQRFSQVTKTKNNYYGGTGIGLEVVKAFTELHRGKIKVFSKVGKGSNFIVSFLLGKEHFTSEEISFQNNYYQYGKEDKVPPTLETIPAIENQKTENSTINLNTKKEHTLLIVEDNLDLKNYLKSELEKNYNILLAENGKVAFELALKKTPHIILTDVMMPIMDGLELCKKIKGDLKTSHIPLLMLTAKSMSTDKLQGINSGADAYLSKPIEMELLKSTLTQLLTSRQILLNKYAKNGIEINQDATKKITSLDNVFIQKMVEHINDNIGQSKLTVESIAAHFFLSRSQLYRKTKSLTGVTVNEFIKRVRLEEAAKMIKTGDGNISEISYKVGFSSPSYFAKCFKEEFGKLPTELK